MLGFLLSRANFNNDHFETLEPSRIPDVILVKKTYPNRRKKNRTRNWKLKSIAVEAEDVPTTGADKVQGRGAFGRRGGLDQQKVEKDYEMFLRELEEDPELRGSINLYKAATAAAVASGGDVNMSGGAGMSGGKGRRGKKAAAQSSAMDVEDDAMDDGEGAQGGATITEETDDEDEEDFPDIELDELLDGFNDMAVKDEDGPAGQEVDEDDVE